jgi:glycosyltransferase involved in cell wall biosynthesis
MKKILHISKYFYPYYGGIEDVARTIVDELKPYFEQRIICFNHERGSIYNINGADVLRIGTTLTIASQPISFTYRRKLQKMIDVYKPDFIHLHLPNPLIATYILTLNLHGAKIISHWHADILGKNYFYPFYKPFENKLLEKSYKIVATSEMYKNYSIPIKNFKAKTVILPNTVNETKLHLFEGEQEEIEKIRAKYNYKKIVFFVGRHVPYKGIDFLMEAEKVITEDCIIVIAGTGELTESLKNKVGENQRIKFIGRLSNNELKYYLYASDVFAFPSHNRSEAFGVALAEALYCGLPAVSFNIEGSGSLWVNKDKHTGFIVENRNVSEFAAAISKILASDELRNEMSKNAVQWVKSNFLKDQIIPIMHEIYS